jgi:septum site-determining protein MinD
LENRIVYDIVDVIEGRCRLKQAMIRDKKLPDLYLIPAAQTRDKNAISPTDMNRLIKDLRSDFDYVLIDSPAGIERGFRNAIAAADRVVVITNPEVSAVRDADRVIGILEAEDKGPAALVINRLNPRLVKNNDMLSPEDVLDLLAIELIGIVPEDENVIIGSNRGAPVAYDPKSRAGQAFRNIARRIKGETVPFMDLESQGGLWERIQRLAGRK